VWFRGWGEETKREVLEAQVDAEDAGVWGKGLEVSCGMAKALDEEAFRACFRESAGCTERFEGESGFAEEGAAGHDGRSGVSG
jgi:hypothetical protein